MGWGLRLNFKKLFISILSLFLVLVHRPLTNPLYAKSGFSWSLQGWIGILGLFQ